MQKNEIKIKCVACSIFKKIIDDYECFNKNSIDVQYLTSMLHMHPEALDEKLKNIIADPSFDKTKTILFYGDCSPNMYEFQNKSNIHKIEGMNCIEILLGSDLYKKLRHEGAYFLLPEWVARWKEIFQYELGLDNNVGREFLKEFHTKFIYLDTKQTEIPVELLATISGYFDLPYEILQIDREIIFSKIGNIIKNINDE